MPWAGLTFRSVEIVELGLGVPMCTGWLKVTWLVVTVKGAWIEPSEVETSAGTLATELSAAKGIVNDVYGAYWRPSSPSTLFPPITFEVAIEIDWADGRDITE